MQAINSILITGSSGTIGTRLCEALQKNYQIHCLDREPNKWIKSLDNSTIHADLLDQTIFPTLPENIDTIIHLAANARVHDLVIDPVQALENIQTTFNILEFARKREIKRLIFASSREVYGNQPSHFSPQTSNKRVDQCAFTKEASISQTPESQTHINYTESPYSASKLSGEALVRSYQKCYGQDFIIFRFSNVYGMYDDSDRVIPKFIRLCQENKPLTVYGQEKLLDFTYIDDAITGITSALENFETAKNETYNLAYSEGTPLTKVAELIKTHLNSTSEIKIEPTRVGEVFTYIADISKAKSAFGFSPKTSIEQGIQKSIEWYQANF